jgi:hypothetical protein
MKHTMYEVVIENWRVVLTGYFSFSNPISRTYLNIIVSMFNGDSLLTAGLPELWDNAIYQRE